MKSIQGSKKINLFQQSAYRFLQMLVNYVQTLVQSLYNNLPSCLEWITIFGLHRTNVGATWDKNYQEIEVPLKAPLGLY